MKDAEVKAAIKKNNIKAAKVLIYDDNGLEDEEFYGFNTENGFDHLMFFVSRNNLVSVDEETGLPAVMVSDYGTKFVYEYIK